MLSAMIRVLSALQEPSPDPRPGAGQAPEAPLAGIEPPLPVVHQLAPEPPPKWWDILQALALEVEQLKIKVEGLPGLWREEVDRAERAAERERKSASRSRKKPAPSDDDEELEAGDLRLLNEDGSRAERLSSVPTHVAPSLDQTLSAARTAIARAALFEQR